MPKNKKSSTKRKAFSRFLSRGTSDLEFLVLLFIFICIGLAAGVGYLGSNAKNATPKVSPILPTLPPSNERIMLTLSAQRGVNWNPRGKWQMEKDMNWRGIESDLRDMKEANISWVRVTYDPDMKVNQRLIQLIRQYNIQPIVVIPGNPLKTKGAFYHRMFYRNNVEKIASTFLGQVQYFEVGNEPNNPDYWDINIEDTSNQQVYEQSVADYIERLKDTVTAIKKKNPNARILLGGLSPKGLERWMNAFMNLEGYKYIDIVSYHPYAESPDKVVAEVYMLKKKMAEIADFGVKPIWVTEVGYTTDADTSSDVYVKDEKTKAEYAKNLYGQLRDSGIYGPIFWYTFVETESTKPGFGLIMKDKTTVKATYLPAFEAIKNLQ